MQSIVVFQNQLLELLGYKTNGISITTFKNEGAKHIERYALYPFLIAIRCPYLITLVKCMP